MQHAPAESPSSPSPAASSAGDAWRRLRTLAPQTIPPRSAGYGCRCGVRVRSGGLLECGRLTLARGLLGESGSGSSNLDNRRKPLARPRCARARQWRRRTRCRQRQRRGSPGDCGSRWAWRACCGCGSQQRACRRGAPPSVERAEQRRVRRRRRPGGRVAAWEPDWGLTFISSSDQRASAAVADRVERETHNPRVGRNLATLFERAGLSNISVVARIGLWETLDVVEERLRPTEAVRELVADGKLTRTQADAWLAELREDAAAALNSTRSGSNPTPRPRSASLDA